MQRIGFVIQEGFQMIGLAAQAVFEYSNRVAGKGVYEVRVLSEKGGAVRSSLGIALQAERLSGRAFDTLIVIGTEDASAITTPGVLNFIRRGLKQSRRVASICTGAFTMGEAGLLEGRRATTHWYYARELQRRFPEVKVEEVTEKSVEFSPSPRAPALSKSGASLGLMVILISLGYI